MNLPDIRSLHPLALVALATAVAVVCFSVIPATTLGLVFAQTTLAAASMLVLLVLTQPDILSRRRRDSLEKSAGHFRRNKKTLRFAATFLFANGLFVGIVTALSAMDSMSCVGIQAAAEPVFTSLANIALFIAVCVVTGVFEEGLFRGIISRGFSDALFTEGRKNPVLVGAIASALVFGLLHTTNAPVAELTEGVAVVQLAAKTVQATLFGFVMSAVLFHMNSLWTVVFLHTGFNLLSMGPAFVITGKLPTTYATGTTVDLVVLLISVVLLVPLAVCAWRILVSATSPCVHEPTCIL